MWELFKKQLFHVESLSNIKTILVALLTQFVELSLGALWNTFDFSLHDVDHRDCETGYLPDRKHKWYVNLSWDFYTATRSPAYFPNH